MGIVVALIVVFIASVIIARASDAFEAASDYLGRNLTAGVKGATINAIGSSMPELFTTFIFLVVLKDAEGFAGSIGTTAGSAIFNGMIIPAVVGMVVIFNRIASGIEVSRSVILRDGISLILCEFFLIILLSESALTWVHGVVLMLLYVAYVGVLLMSMRRNKRKSANIEQEREIEEIEDDINENESPKLLFSLLTFKWLDLHRIVLSNRELKGSSAWLLLILSTVLMGVACHWLVESCIWLGSSTYYFLGVEFHGLNLPIYFLSVIIASAATSLPDTILSLKDAKKGNYNDAISNALGSNIFDICFALGFPLFIFTVVNGPLTLSAKVIEEVSELRILLLILTVVSFFIFYIGRKFGLIKSMMLLVMYLFFVLYILGDTLGWEFVGSIKGVLFDINAFLNS